MLSYVQWDKLSSASGYLPSSLTSCLNDLLALFSEAATLPHPAIREKYTKDRYTVNPGMFYNVSGEMFQAKQSYV